MEVITIESKAFKELQAKIDTIVKYIFDRQVSENVNEDDMSVDSYDVCTFLKVSDRTLQRLRSKGEVSFSRIRGRNFYKVSEIKRLLESHLIKSTQECLDDLIANQQLHVKERGNLK